MAGRHDLESQSHDRLTAYQFPDPRSCLKPGDYYAGAHGNPVARRRCGDVKPAVARSWSLRDHERPYAVALRFLPVRANRSPEMRTTQGRGVRRRKETKEDLTELEFRAGEIPVPLVQG